MTKTIDTGVFIPVGNHGWIHSIHSPEVEDGSFRRVLDIVRHAEANAFDFVLSPAIWRGRKGPSRHWMSSVESITTSAALLQATDTISIFSTVHMTLYQPPIIAKMISTLDQIGPGRVGLNLVTGSSYLDLAHLGMWRDDLNHDERYDFGDEWISLVRKLWTEETVDFDGRFFHTDGATMGPKPSRMPPLVNAGSSPRGIRFAAENCDIAFLVISDDPKQIATAKQCKVMARDLGKPRMKTYGVVMVIPAETDALAHQRLEHFDAGVDTVCMADIRAGYEQNPDIKSTSEGSRVLAGGGKVSSVSKPVVGSYANIAERLSKIVIESEIDAVMFIVPDFVADLTTVAKEILPRMRQFGVNARTSA